MDDMETLKRNVRLRLGVLDKSMAKVAEEIGVSRARVSWWSTAGNPTLTTLGRLAQALGVPTFELLNPNFDPRNYPVDGVEEAV